MLVFLDESGDSGRAFDRGSSRYFTLAAVGFETPTDAAACQARLVDLSRALRMHPRAEFHFRTDSHDRRLSVLLQLRASHFRVSAFTVDKVKLPRTAAEATSKQAIYQTACLGALDGFGDALSAAHVTLDGSRETAFQRELGRHLKQSLGGDGNDRIAGISIQRSNSDPLLQVADYCAGVLNRVMLRKAGGDEYFRAIEAKLLKRVTWP